jgi:hypothetical protein
VEYLSGHVDSHLLQAGLLLGFFSKLKIEEIRPVFYLNTTFRRLDFISTFGANLLRHAE